jgi:hypothetical protein
MTAIPLTAQVARIYSGGKPPTLTPLGATLAAYDDWDETELRAELAKRLGLTAENLMHAAAIWSVLERKGADLSGLKDGMSLYLPHIAAGTVLPELVVAFASRPVLLRKLARLTPGDQRRMVDGENVELVLRPGENVQRPVRLLSAREVNQVFGDGTIRTDREQLALINQVAPPWKPGKPVKRGKVVVDRTRALVSIGRSSAPLTDLIEALKKAGVSY